MYQLHISSIIYSELLPISWADAEDFGRKLHSLGSSKGHKKPVIGTILLSMGIQPLEVVVFRACYSITFILTEVIDVNNLFGVITCKEKKHTMNAFGFHATYIVHYINMKIRL